PVSRARPMSSPVLDLRRIVIAALVAGLVLLPLYAWASGDAFALTLFTRIVILALAASSLNLILGYGGMMSFGHAAYLGIGGSAIRILPDPRVTSRLLQIPISP